MRLFKQHPYGDAVMQELVSPVPCDPVKNGFWWPLTKIGVPAVLFIVIAWLLEMSPLILVFIMILCVFKMYRFMTKYRFQWWPLFNIACPSCGKVITQVRLECAEKGMRLVHPCPECLKNGYAVNRFKLPWIIWGDMKEEIEIQSSLLNSRKEWVVRILLAVTILLIIAKMTLFRHVSFL